MYVVYYMFLDDMYIIYKLLKHLDHKKKYLCRNYLVIVNRKFEEYSKSNIMIFFKKQS